MKAVICFVKEKGEFIRVMKLVEHFGEIVDENITNDEIKNDNNSLYIPYKNVLYKFNRFNSEFINAVENAIKSSPFLQYEGPLHIINIDNRFTNPKYFTITKNFRYETFELNKDLIIEDLYNKNYVTNTNTININKKFGFDI